MKIIKITLYVFFLAFSTSMVFSAKYNNLGVNIVDGGAFVNIINHTNRYINVSSYDSLGWAKSDFDLVLMDHRPAREWAGVIDDPEEYRIDYSGTYKSSFKGQADVIVSGSKALIKNKYYDSLSNTTYFDLVIPEGKGKDYGFVYMSFKNTIRDIESPINSGITELKIMRSGYDLDTKKVFNDKYIQLLKSANFKCYRFYTVQNIWEGEPKYPQKTLWKNRKTPFDASQQTMKSINGKADGWSWEYIIQLANILNRDIWINILISCDSNYVINLAKMLKDNLNPNINIYIENSNEVWSAKHGTEGPYNKAQADEYGISFDENYARRTVELSNLFAQVFGKDEINKRIRVILSGQHSYIGRHNPHLNYINDNFGPPKNYVYALSTALYFGSTKPNGSIEEINQGMIEEIDGQINNPEKNTYRKAHINKAAEWDLLGGCTSYEGGIAIPSGGGTNNLDNQIQANRTSAMKDILKKNFADGWFDIGGGLALQFTIWGSYTRYGCWGLTDDFNNPDRNYKMQAIRELIGDWIDTKVPDYAGNQNIKTNNFPNPFSDNSVIKYSIDKADFVVINLYNELGFKIKTLFNKYLTSGKYELNINANDLQSGIYFYKIESGNNIGFGKFVIAK